MSIFKKIKQNQGQSIVETLIAVGVIIVGVVGVLSLVVGASSAGKVSKEVIIGTNLAREGTEVVRSLRDNNWMQEKSWMEGIIQGGDERYCRAIFNPQQNSWSLDSISATDLFDNQYKLYFSDYYNHSGQGRDTGFFRQILIKKNSSEIDELQVTVKTGWLQNGKQKEIVIEDVLTDWLAQGQAE